MELFVGRRRKWALLSTIVCGSVEIGVLWMVERDVASIQAWRRGDGISDFTIEGIGH